MILTTASIPKTEQNNTIVFWHIKIIIIIKQIRIKTTKSLVEM